MNRRKFIQTISLVPLATSVINSGETLHGSTPGGTKELPLDTKNIFTPTPKQYKFASLPFEIKEAGYGGGLGSGKTEILLNLPLLYNFFSVPEFRGLLLRKYYRSLEEEVIPRSKEIFPKLGGIYNITRNKWVFPSGAEYSFGHLGNNDINKYLNSRYHYIGLDEAVQFSQDEYEKLRDHCSRSYTDKLPAIVRWASSPNTPPASSYKFFKSRFIDPAPKGHKIIKDKYGNLRMFVPAYLSDNPHSSQAYPNYFSHLKSTVTDAEFKEVIGSWE